MGNADAGQLGWSYAGSWSAQVLQHSRCPSSNCGLFPLRLYPIICSLSLTTLIGKEIQYRERKENMITFSLRPRTEGPVLGLGSGY